MLGSSAIQHQRLQRIENWCKQEEEDIQCHINVQL